MATIQGSRVTEPLVNGTGYGKAVSKWGNQTFAAHAAGTVSHLCRIPAGSLITGLRYVNAALGAGVTVDYGMIEGTAATATKFFTAVASNATGAASWAGVPFKVTDETVITATTAAAAATGDIDVVVDYVYQGTAYTSF